MSQPFSNVASLIQTAVAQGAHSVTKFISPKHVVKVTQRLRHGRILPRKNENIDFVVTIGSPNYADRLFIKDALAAKEPFPIKKALLRFPSVPRVTAPQRKGRLTKAEKKVRSLAARVLAQTRQRGN